MAISLKALESERVVSNSKIQRKKEGGDRKDPIECFACGEFGHYSNKYLQRKRAEDGYDENNSRSAHVTWDASTFATYQVKKVNATGMLVKFKRTEVLLDNQADVSVMHPFLLREIGPAEENISINGVGSHQLTVERERGLL